MDQYISKSNLVAEIENKIKKYTKRGEESDAKRDGYGMYWGGVLSCLNEIRTLCDTLKVKEVETSVIPKHSYFEEIYHCGSEPRWKIGDVLAVYEFYSDYEGEYIYGKITDIKMDETEDWCYTFENGDMVYENRLISDETYKKN